LKRQKRIQEQLDNKELVEAGLLLPSNSCGDDLSSVGSSTEENYCNTSYKPAKKISRLPAYDWWNPGIYFTLKFLGEYKTDKILSKILFPNFLYIINKKNVLIDNFFIVTSSSFDGSDDAGIFRTLFR
jgi:hypothetical protein